jgi:hypothetical protein
MVSLTVSRDSGYTDHFRAYAVVVDGRKIGKLRNGETREFSIEPGSHTIRAKIDWCGSHTQQFTAAEGEPLFFRIKSNLRGTDLAKIFRYVIFENDSYLNIEQLPGPEAPG